MAQAKTLQQRKAIAMYEKREAAKRGKPASLTKKPEVNKPPISKYWIAALLFVLVGGAVLEAINIFFWGSKF